MKKNNYSRKVCLVTGAGRGIGRNIAWAMGRAGYILALTDINAQLLSELEGQMLLEGLEARVFTFDLSVHGESNKLINEVIGVMGRVDVLINNARAGKRFTFESETEANWDLALNVNVKVPFLLSQAVIPHMKEGGSIINIGSVSGKLVSQESPGYQVSKAGMLHLTRYLAVYSGYLGIRVNAILPGFIVQDEHRDRFSSAEPDQEKFKSIVNFLHPLSGGPGYANDIANAVVFLASNEAKFITGQEIVVDGGLTIQDPTKVLFNYVKEHLG